MGLLSALVSNAQSLRAFGNEFRQAIAPPIRDARRYHIRDRQGRYWSGASWVASAQRGKIVTGQDPAWEIVDKIAPDDEDIFLSEIRA